MSIDIMKSKSVLPINHGSVVVSISPNRFIYNNLYSQNYPSISDIETKYQTRFDNPSYYYGGGIGSVDGGSLDDDDISTGVYDGGTYEG